MNADLIERIKRVIQGWVEEYHPNLRIGCDKSQQVFPVWVLTRFTLPNPQELGKTQLELESINWTEEEYIDQLKSWIGGRSGT